MTQFIRFLASTLLCLYILPIFAVAEVLIAPTRVVLEKGERTAELVIVNKGTEEAAYRISVENRRMLENGSMEIAEDTRDDELFAKDFVRFSPRRIMLQPGARQTIRVSANTASLQAGEYRSHLRVMSAPTSAGRSLTSAAGPGGEDISIELIAIRSLTIPIIARVGDLDASVQLESAEINPSDNEAESVLVARLNRVGTKSTFGDIQIFVEGQNEPVYFARGIAVYTPNTTRDVMLPLPDEVR
ncbi:unnamed protein product, partial [Chrysoparadoxa australica]